MGLDSGRISENSTTSNNDINLRNDIRCQWLYNKNDYIIRTTEKRKRKKYIVISNCGYALRLLGLAK